jgi:hypothetical protein
MPRGSIVGAADAVGREPVLGVVSVAVIVLLDRGKGEAPGCVIGPELRKAAGEGRMSMRADVSP